MGDGHDGKYLRAGRGGHRCERRLPASETLASAQYPDCGRQYDHARAINLGANRWFVKPGIGVSKAAGRWTFEANGAVTFFSANGDFVGGNKVTRKPLYSAQGHLIYSFRSGVWASADATFYTGGRTTLNGSAADNLERNIRAGATLALPINRRSSIKLYASTGVSSRTGNNFDLFGAAWQYRWGGGL